MKSWLIIRSWHPPFSYRIKARVPIILLILAMLTFATVIFSICVGQFAISPLDVLETLFGAGSSRYTFIIVTLRLPRALVALLVGMGFATAGAILQGLTRNPLASPDVIGISQGASLAAAAVIIIFTNVPIGIIPFAALVGASCMALLVYLLAWRGGSSPTRLILVGVGLAAVSAAFVQIMISAAQIMRVSQALIWLVGSVYGRSWETFWPLLSFIVVFLAVTLFMSRHLDALHLGDDLARGLGSNIEWQRGLLLISCVALAGSSVAAAGTVGFVGLMAPHIARRLVGPSHGSMIPVAALIGAFTVTLADLLGRMLLPPIEIPCGVITAAVGAPYFIWLLLRSRNL